MGQAVVHFEVLGSGAEETQKFYGEMFGWKFNADNEFNYGLVAPDDNSSKMGNGIGGGVGGVSEGAPPYATFYVAVPDVGAALERAESLGGQKLFGPERIMEQVEIGLFSDPDGSVVGLVKDEAPPG